jgi:hypothetical protein
MSTMVVTSFWMTSILQDAALRAYKFPVDVEDFVCREIGGHTYMSFSLSSASLCCSTTRSNAERMTSSRPWT